MIDIPFTYLFYTIIHRTFHKYSTISIHCKTHIAYTTLIFWSSTCPDNSSITLQATTKWKQALLMIYHYTTLSVLRHACRTVSQCHDSQRPGDTRNQVLSSHGTNRRALEIPPGSNTVPPLCKNITSYNTRRTQKINVMTTDDLGMQGARPSAVMMLLNTSWVTWKFHIGIFSIPINYIKHR